MRLDKFLKVSRLAKRRTVANDLCSGGCVLVNRKVAKPATEIHVEDELSLDLGHHQLVVKVVEVPAKAVPAQSASSLYTVVSETYNSRD